MIHMLPDVNTNGKKDSFIPLLNQAKKDKLDKTAHGGFYRPSSV